MRKMRTMLGAYREAAGLYPVILFHDGDHGQLVIDELDRHASGLPTNALPFLVNEVSRIVSTASAAATTQGEIVFSCAEAASQY